MKIAQIPFSGFYHSLHDMALDDALDMAVSDSSGEPNADLHERAFDAIDWGHAHSEYAKAYAENFLSEFGIRGAFESMHSPREYNFTTDRIFITLADDELQRVYDATPAETLASCAREMFTSRDGFASFYSPDVDDWGDLDEWDHNQIFCLINAYVLDKRQGEEFDSDAEYSLMEANRDNGYIDGWLDKNPEAVRIFNIASYLRQREERAYR